MVNFSVRAQNFIMKKGLVTYRNNQETNTITDPFNSTGIGNFSMATPTPLNKTFLGKDPSDFEDMATKDNSEAPIGNFMLPTIKYQPGVSTSPFKGFIDTSIITKKLRKNTTGSDGKRNQSVRNDPHHRLSMYSTVSEPVVAPKERFRSTARADKKEDKMSPKVLETWVNETLEDAEHMDIPGVILNPANRQPATRYGIDRTSLEKEGITPEAVDRVYKALFVYSVGFYELLQVCLQHTKHKYSVVTRIWKAFSILLE